MNSDIFDFFMALDYTDINTVCCVGMIVFIPVFAVLGVISEFIQFLSPSNNSSSSNNKPSRREIRFARRELRDINQDIDWRMKNYGSDQPTPYSTRQRKKELLDWFREHHIDPYG